MSYANRLDNSYEARLKRNMKALRWQKIHLDPVLLMCIVALMTAGLFILYSASNQSSLMLKQQITHFFIGFIGLFVVAQIPPARLQQATPWLFFMTVLLLVGVLLLGHVSQGARRWIGFSHFQVQPSEMMKLAMPMMLAWLLDKQTLPPSNSCLFMCSLIIAIPAALIIKQPDLGTAILITLCSLSVIFFAGISWKAIASLFATITLSAPLLWHFLHQYQKQRILTMLHPTSDPLGAGYNIIQSKIAVGSGGLFGKGYLLGTQAHMAFLPTHTTDFIFAVSAEEFGLLGALALLLLFLLVFARCMYISQQSQSSYTRLLAGSLSCSFIINALMNIGMVIGILPVVGVPLPLISYGGSAIVTNFINFGILMSIHTHKKLWSS